MAKRTKKKARQSRKLAAPTSPKPTADNSEYWLSRASRELECGREQKATEYLARAWPSAEAVDRAARMRWLIRHWPRRAVDEMASGGADVDAVTDAILMLDDETIEAFAALDEFDASWRNDARALRHAAERVAAGDDVAARAALRTIGLRSPFRDGRLFVRGLIALYAKADDEAIGAFQRLVDGAAYGRTARALLDRLGVDDAGADDEANAKVRQVFAAPTGGVREIAKLLGERRTNAALRVVADRMPNLPPELRAALHADLPGALLAAGVEASGALTRLRKAIAAPPDDPRRTRQVALTAEKARVLYIAIDEWHQYADELAADRRSWSSTQRPLAAAAVEHHIAALVTEEAEADERHDRPYYGYFSPQRRQISAERAHAVEHLERAVKLDPACVDYWHALIEATRQARDKPALGRAHERFAKRFPDHPDALTAAAEAASKRKAFDKGLRYARRAAELQPLSRLARDLEASMLSGKARKKFAEGVFDVARRLAAEAVAVPHQTPAHLRSTSAIAGAIEAALVDVDAAIAERKAAVDAFGACPWGWTLDYMRALDDLPVGEGSRRRGGHRPSLLRYEPALAPVSPPTRQTLTALISDADEATESDPPESLHHAIGQLVGAAIEAGGAQLDDPDVIERALELVKFDGRIVYPFAKRANERWPKRAEIAIARYRAALELKLPVDAFTTADADLRRAFEAARPAEPSDEPDWFAENPYHRVRRLIVALRDAVKRHVRQVHRKPKKATQSRTTRAAQATKPE